MLTGNDLVTGEKEVQYREVLTVESGTVNLTKTPVGALKGLYILNIDGSNGEELTLGDAVNENEYSITGKVVTVNSTIADKTQVVAYYTVEVMDSKTIRVTSDAFPQSFKVVLDVLVTSFGDKALYPAQLTIYNAKAQDDWSFEMAAESDPSVCNIPLEILKNPTSSDMWSLTIFDEEDIL